MKNAQQEHSHENSRYLFERAKEVIPGGVTANIKYFSPHPIFMKKANGSKLIDVDDNEYIDYTLCYGALITGHGNDQIKNAAINYMEDIGSTIFGTPHELEIKLAEKLVDLYPSVEAVRYANSGLEAMLLSVRLAVAYTGKKKIAKFEGHYHGGFNQVLFSVNPDQQDAGESSAPKTVPESKGIPDDELDNTIVLPFNDLDATYDILKKHKDELAAVILEPIQGGFIPADKAFMEGLRKITEDLDILLIFDEVKTGFRVDLGGAQKVYDIVPDITALGKVLGGGFPIGAVGGKREIMMLSAADKDGDVFSVGGKSNQTTNIVFHSGTYNGHPIILKAGLETIEMIEADGVLDRLFATTKELRDGLERLYESYDIPMKTIGMGSIFNIVLADEPVRNYRDMWKANTDLRLKLDEALLELGIYVKPLNRYSLSTAHHQKDIQKTIEAHEQAIKQVYVPNKKWVVAK